MSTSRVSRFSTPNSTELPTSTNRFRHPFTAYPKFPLAVEGHEHLAKADEDVGLCKADSTPAEGTRLIRRAEQCRQEHAAEPSETRPRTTVQETDRTNRRLHHRRVLNNVKFTASDMSGRDGYRSMWESMYAQCDAIVFVVDSTDQMRFAVVKDELDMMLRHPDVADRPDLPVLFVANKAAAPDACGASALAGALRLHEHMEQDRPWRLASTDAVAAPGQPADDGLCDAMEWLAELIAIECRRQTRFRVLVAKSSHRTQNGRKRLSCVMDLSHSSAQI
ncbi:hypothetical protein AGLY_001652 [Aphis glycines]|uniref:ADP-ribosylation factor-like protein 6 n=1 Tax=Aphis glycines TaxID=307491 RepID=A0A6G0U4U4_APHGL|nr:hypothetical protein AGLY_001652 [Aphis glycines]